MVLAGRADASPSGRQDELREGDVVAFAEGPDGAHKVSNNGDATCAS